MIKNIIALLLTTILLGCSSKQEQIKGAFGFRFGEKPELYKFKEGDEYEIVVEPANVREPNPLFKEYSLNLDTETIEWLSKLIQFEKVNN